MKILIKFPVIFFKHNKTNNKLGQTTTSEVVHRFNQDFHNFLEHGITVVPPPRWWGLGVLDEMLKTMDGWLWMFVGSLPPWFLFKEKNHPFLG